MGADMITTGITYAGNWPKKTDKKKMLSTLKKMRIEENDWTFFYDQTGDEIPFLENEETIDEKQIREDVKKTIKEFFDRIDCGEIMSINIHDMTFIMTGGMSWGDDPTDSFSTIEKFSRLPNELLKTGNFKEPTIYETFIKHYNKKLTPQLKTKLKAWRIATRI